MKKEWIIPLTILFFIFVGILSWFAVDGNAVCVFLLNLLGGAFMFSIFVIFPAVNFSKILPSKITFGHPLLAGIVLFSLFWVLVVAIISIKPEWGWNYVRIFDKYIMPLIESYNPR